MNCIIKDFQEGKLKLFERDEIKLKEILNLDFKEKILSF
jgi:hypothetical protein